MLADNFAVFLCEKVEDSFLEVGGYVLKNFAPCGGLFRNAVEEFFSKVTFREITGRIVISAVADFIYL